MLINPQTNQPFQLSALTQEIAAPSLAGVRHVLYETIVGKITPERMANLLVEAAQTTDPRPYLTMAEEMEEREGHYYSELVKRKLAVSSIDFDVEAASEDAADVKIAEAVKEMFQLTTIRDSREDLLDGLGKGFSVNEIVWDTSEKQWMPKQLIHRDARWFLFDIVDRSTLRLRDEADPAFGVVLPLYKFVRHIPRLKTGIPIRNGLARLVAFSWVCKQYALKDWMAFAEVFGMPIRVGMYPASATPQDVKVLRYAVANIGSDAAAVLPESMKIEFQKIEGSNSADLFERLSTYLDGQISKIVLGQTMSADAKSTGIGSGNANLHGEVRADIRDFDCRQLESTYDRDLVKPFVDLNFGPQKRYPQTRIRLAEEEDIVAFSEAVSKLVPIGLKIGQKVVRERLSIPDPEPDDELLAPPAAPEPPDDGDGETVPPGRGKKKKPGAQPPDDQRAQNRRGPIETVPENQVDRAAKDGDPIVRGWVRSIRGVLEQSTSLEDFRDRLLELYPDLPTRAFGELMQEALVAAALAGRHDIVAQAHGG
jgi:phage gp29-like protein